MKTSKKAPIIPLPLQTYRDVLLFELENQQVMVVGCDSSGGIGPKPLDKLKVSGYILGKFTARVVLMEVLATGAKPLCLVDALGVELNPTGLEILKGLKEEAARAGLEPRFAVTGSSEKNFEVEQTGIGVTAIGLTTKDLLKIGTSQPRDLIVAIGIPSVGNEVIQAEKEGKTADCLDVLKLLSLEFVHEVIPAGSMGIAHEVEILAKSAKLGFKLPDQQKVNVKKSAGPATVIIATLPKSNLANLKAQINKPINLVGSLT